MYTTSHVVLFQLGVCTFSSLGPMLLTSGLWNGQSESNKLLCSILCWWIRPGRHIPHKGECCGTKQLLSFSHRVSGHHQI